MNVLRTDKAILHENEIEAIKINQEIIKRMAIASQNVKTLFLTLCTVILTFLSSNLIKPTLSMYITFIALSLAFWFMDASYLKLERQFIKHHNAIINGKLNYLKQWDFNPKNYKVSSILKIMLSSFAFIIYEGIILIVFILMLLYLPAL